MRRAKVLMDRDFAIGAHRSSLVRRLRRASRTVAFMAASTSRVIPTADAKGFRKDVLALVTRARPDDHAISRRQFRLRATIGRTASARSKSARRASISHGSAPSRTDSAPMNSSTGAARPTVEPMLAVNLGTRGGDAARNLVEYCNHPGGSAWSDLRRAHGWEKPHDVRFWCLGNEMDGPWQMEYKTATALRRGGARSGQDDAVGRSDHRARGVRVVGAQHARIRQWEDTVLEHTFDHVGLHFAPYLSQQLQAGHRVFSRQPRPDGQIHRRGGGIWRTRWRRSGARNKRIMLSFDEWNVWYRTRRTRADRVKEGWPIAPPILEEIYTMEDALAFGGACISLLNHADRVKTACLAQLVNVIAPIMTETGGPAGARPSSFRSPR